MRDAEWLSILKQDPNMGEKGVKLCDNFYIIVLSKKMQNTFRKRDYIVRSSNEIFNFCGGVALRENRPE